MSTIGRTSLSSEEFETARLAALRILARDGRVTNRTLRESTALNYDQAIKFFNRATEEGHLERRGRAGGVHYVECPQKGAE